MSPTSACCLRNCRRRPTGLDLGGDSHPFRVCRGRRQRNFFFAAPFGKLQPADANALTHLDLDLQPAG